MLGPEVRGVKGRRPALGRGQGRRSELEEESALQIPAHGRPCLLNLLWAPQGQTGGQGQGLASLSEDSSPAGLYWA